MSFPKFIVIVSLVAFGFVGGLSLFRDAKKPEEPPPIQSQQIQEISLKKEEPVLRQPLPVAPIVPPSQSKKLSPPVAKNGSSPAPSIVSLSTSLVQNQGEKVQDEELPKADIIEKLFVTDSSKLPFVETVSYTSRAPWLKGRPAWIADYASYYETSRHFIARSLNRKPDYISQKVLPGDRFNVLRKDKPIEFLLLVDLSRNKMWFYAFDKAANERYLLKTYSVGSGKKDSKKASGCMTPLGKFSLGSKVAIYKPGAMGYFHERKIEMIRVFGTRWLPFSEEIAECSDVAKGYGLHGLPWVNDASTGQLTEERELLGKSISDGCIRLASEDIEEIFSIVITKPTTVEIVKEFNEAKLPGTEKTL